MAALRSMPSPRSYLGPMLVLIGMAILVGLSSTAADASSARATAEDAPAYDLQQGSLARNRIVALGRDLIIAGEAMSHAVALGGDLHLSGTIRGDAIILGGDAHLASTAEVAGDLYVLGGHIEMAPGAIVGGRSAAYPDASDVWVALLESPSGGASRRAVTGARIALLAFWSFLMLLLFAIGRRELIATSESIRFEPMRNFLIGLTGVAAMVMTALLCSSIAGSVIGVPLLVLVAVVALGLRFWGMVAVFHALGAWLCQRVVDRQSSGKARRPPLPITAATCGLLALGVIKFLPYLGVWVWSAASFIGVGAALSTKLGRREAWFEL